ncbi:MinD/ParA family protein [Thermosulfurimonas sp. F29]|uniref:MinD/ParA family protein n=1 Tax=Thermosulfurimonas sp. F29 TaxID=2867247 RepID=UPI001C837D7E|nr:MinD/ParA family protein [Thermosulfurimonas sp. F29]MBX6423600.1 MinD/ParA family protein [Thermosulfurimonas sp. F29]
MRILSVSSGKGGVGKTNLVANLALALEKKGYHTLIFDADLGLANIDVLLGLAPERDIRHVLSGECTLKDILIKTPYGFEVIPASSGVVELTRLDPSEKMALKDQFEEVSRGVDFFIFDLGAGISDNVLFFNLVAQERIVITTPEPTAMADAYALIKLLFLRHQVKRVYLLVNMVKDEREGKAVYQQIAQVVERFLGPVGLTYLGALRSDPCVAKAVRRQEPFLEVYPEASVSQDLSRICEKLLRLKPKSEGGLEALWSQSFRATS